MIRRPVAAALFAALAVLAACGSDTPKTASTTTSSTSIPPTTSTTAASSPVTRAPGTGDARAAATAVNAFGYDLLRANLGSTKGNVAMSAWSIATALGMVRLGAKDETARQMDKVLHADAGFAAGMNALDRAVAARNGTFPFGDETRTVEVRAANRAFAQSGYPLQQAFLDDLSRYYGSTLGQVDYVGATEKARNEINGWVSDQTAKRIPELLAKDVLNELTRLVVVNAVYLKADWATPFRRENTAEGSFHAPSGDVTVATMHGRGGWRFSSGPRWKAVELTYAGDNLAMTVLLPDTGQYDTVAGQLDASLLAKVDQWQNDAEVHLALPKFDIARATKLRPQLAALGMPLAFSGGDFSGISTADQLEISDVIHQANVTVDEKGTVAAAATAATVEVVSGPARTVEIVIDRPFIFLLRDNPTGAVLFAGQVTNPATK